MQIRVLTLAAGPNGIIQPGTVVDLPDAVAATWVGGGYAVPIYPPAIEYAMDPAPELAEKRGPGRPRKAA